MGVYDPTLEELTSLVQIKNMITQRSQIVLGKEYSLRVSTGTRDKLFRNKVHQIQYNFYPIHNVNFLYQLNPRPGPGR